MGLNRTSPSFLGSHFGMGLDISNHLRSDSRKNVDSSWTNHTKHPHNSINYILTTVISWVFFLDSNQGWLLPYIHQNLSNALSGLHAVPCLIFPLWKKCSLRTQTHTRKHKRKGVFSGSYAPWCPRVP